MKSKALLLIAQFFDNGYHVIFTPNALILEHQADASKYFRGIRDATTRMWSIDLTPPVVTSEPATNWSQEYFTANKVQSTGGQEANNVYNFTVKRNIVRYLHHSAGSPVPETWIKAINNGNYVTWLGLTSQLVRKHLPKSE